MRNQTIFLLINILTMVTTMGALLAQRSVHRPRDPFVPEITTRWVGDTTEHHLKHTHLTHTALFAKYDHDYLMAHVLPDTTVTYRGDSEKQVLGALLKELLEEFISTLQQQKKRHTKFKDFIILKQRDYNPKRQAGLVVAKFKDYPFVAKIFIEKPETFVNPFAKGFEPVCFFMMGGGMTRYLSGFTRIKNLEFVKNRIKSDPEWQKTIDTPHKWFWIPEKARFFEVIGKNLGDGQHKITYPGVYAIVCDAIEADEANMLSQTNRDSALKLSRFIGARIDPHIYNFMEERSTGKTIIIDTEHFPSMVGLEESIEFQSYADYYGTLAWKFVRNTYFTTKKERRERAIKPPAELLVV